tara:strand:+ start:330 stop:524 length:195 start_codon:yes stop_codon:yes gene_type:complete
MGYVVPKIAEYAARRLSGKTFTFRVRGKRGTGEKKKRIEESGKPGGGVPPGETEGSDSGFICDM